jgi:hypothetical protein
MLLCYHESATDYITTSTLAPTRSNYITRVGYIHTVHPLWPTLLTSVHFAAVDDTVVCCDQTNGLRCAQTNELRLAPASIWLLQVDPVRGRKRFQIVVQLNTLISCLEYGA